MRIRSVTTNGYFALVITAAAFIMYQSVDAHLQLNIPQTAVFTLLAVMAELLPITLSKGAEVTVGFAILMGAILVVGTKSAVWVAFVSSLIMEMKRRGKMPLYKSLFNIAVYVVIVGVSGVIYTNLGGVPGKLTFPEDLVPLLALVFAYLFMNVGLITLALSLLYSEHILHVFRENFRWALPNYLSLAPLGTLLAQIYINIGPVGIVLFVAPLLVARHSFKSYMAMREVYADTIRALAAAMEAKDPYTKGHSERVALYSGILAREMKLPADMVNTLHFAALLHDIGKIGISEAVLNKPASLTKEEFEQIKTHPVMGANIVEKIDFLSAASEFIRSHHERMNGSGYPDGLAGDDISLGAKILAVADTFDAMTSDRPYRSAWPVDKALEEIKRHEGVLFDEKVVEAFTNAYNNGRIDIDVS